MPGQLLDITFNFNPDGDANGNLLLIVAFIGVIAAVAGSAVSGVVNYVVESKKAVREEARQKSEFTRQEELRAQERLLNNLYEMQEALVVVINGTLEVYRVNTNKDSTDLEHHESHLAAMTARLRLRQLGARINDGELDRDLPKLIEVFEKAHTVQTDEDYERVYAEREPISEAVTDRLKILIRQARVDRS